MSHEVAPCAPSAAPLPSSPPSFLQTPQGSIFDSPEKVTSSLPPRPSTAPLTTAVSAAQHSSHIARGPISPYEATHTFIDSEGPPQYEATHTQQNAMGQTMSRQTMALQPPRPSTAPGLTNQDTSGMDDLDPSIMDALEQEIASPIPIQGPYVLRDPVSHPVPSTAPQVLHPVPTHFLPSQYGPVQHATSSVSHAPMGFTQSDRATSPYMDMRPAMPSTPVQVDVQQLIGYQPTPPPQPYDYQNTARLEFMESRVQEAEVYVQTMYSENMELQSEMAMQEQRFLQDAQWVVEPSELRYFFKRPFV